MWRPAVSLRNKLAQPKLQQASGTQDPGNQLMIIGLLHILACQIYVVNLVARKAHSQYDRYQINKELSDTYVATEPSADPPCRSLHYGDRNMGADTPRILRAEASIKPDGPMTLPVFSL